MNISEDYGIDVNMSIVFSAEDGTISAGLHLVDSDGFDVSVEHDGDTMEDVLTYMLEEVDQAMEDFYLEQEDDDEKGYEDVAQMIVDLEDEVKSLKIDNAILQQRIDAIVNDNYTKHSEPKCCDCCCDYDDCGNSIETLEKELARMMQFYRRMK